MRILRGLGVVASVLVVAIASAGIVSPQLDELIERSPNSMVDVVFYLNSAPAYQTAGEVRSEYDPRLRAFGSRAKELARIAIERPLNALEQAERKQTHETIDVILNARAHAVAAALRDRAAAAIAAVRNAISSYGGVPSTNSSILASVRALVPASRVYELAAHANVTYVDVHFAGAPLLDNQAVSLGLTGGGGFWNNGINGGIYDVGVMDSGVQRNHSAFSGFNWEGVQTDPDGHGTGVGGMIFSHNATYRGMAFSLETVCAQDATIGMREATDWLLTETVQTPEAINVSWGGQSPDPNEYQTIEAWYDSAADAFDVTFGQAAGNEGASGWESLVYPAKAYNTIAVGNVYDANTTTRSDDEITNSSSRGPTPSGRKKPDISAPGTETWSTTRTLGFGNLGGTSSAAPKVTGAAVLLRHFGNTSALEDKAVLINSADAWGDNNTPSPSDDGPMLGSHWSRTYGWGYLDLGTAYAQAPYVITDSFTRPIIGRRITYYTGTRTSAFKATLVWNRHVGPYTGEDPVEYHSLTNFNLNLYSGTTGVPISQSISGIDNVEQLGTLSTGPGVLKVQTTGSWDLDVPNEAFALAVPGLWLERTPPAFDITVNTPEFAVVGSEISVTGTVTNTGQLPAYDTLAAVSAVVVGGNNPAQLGTLDPNETANVQWACLVNQSPGPQNIQIGVESGCYGETYQGANSRQVTVIPFFLAPTTYTRVRGSHVAGDLASVTTSNNQYLSHKPGVVLSSQQWPVELVFRGTSPVAAPNYFHARVEGAATSASIRQKVDVWNYATNAWVELSNANLSTTDSTRILTPAGTLSNYVQPGTREVRIRVMAKAFGPVLLYPWVHRLDQVGWHIDD